MKAAHHAIGRFAIVVLNEGDWSYLLVELSLRERLKKVASSIFEYTWFNDDHAINSRFDYFHIFTD